MDTLRLSLIRRLRKPFVDKPDWYDRLPVFGYTVSQEWYDRLKAENEQLKAEFARLKQQKP